MIDRVMQVLGLSEEEIKTFLFLLEKGAQTVGALAKKSGLSRPSLYGFLKKLRDKGLIIELQKNNVKTFYPSKLDSICALFDERISELEKGKVDIEKTFLEIEKGILTTSPKFQLFEGTEGAKFVLKDMLLYRNVQTEAFWPIKKMLDILSPTFVRAFNKERIERKLYTRAIWPASQVVSTKDYPFLGPGEKFLREIRVAPKHIDFSMGYWIYGDKVALVSSRKESYGFIIESREYATMMRVQFELIWNLSRGLKQKSNSEVENFLAEIYGSSK